MLIQVTIRRVYGNDLIYPVNEPARALCALARKRTLSVQDLCLARNGLGHTIEITADGSDAAAAITRMVSEEG